MVQRSLPRQSESQSLPGMLFSFANWLRFTVAGDTSFRKPNVSAYLTRKRELPHSFTGKDWDRALDYWGHKCAICERPRGLWHTLAQDHWIPLTNPDCPGTDPTNILPLCHGTDGCNNSKGKHNPETWLKKKLGKKKATQKLAEIHAYFEWTQDQTMARLGCPHCGGRVNYLDKWRIWECTSCDAFWDHRDIRQYENCPKCQCWMHESDGSYLCPRCNLEWDHTNLPTHEHCPSCERGALKWVYKMGESAGYWRCNKCRSEWLFD
jgi:hypothetical protein